MKKSVVAFIAAVLLSGGCSGSPSKAEGPTDGMTPAETVTEYQAETGNLTLAPGWKWPADLALDQTGPDGAPMFYQRGFGKTRAQWFWYCSWGRLFLSADAAKHDEAWSQLKKIRDLFYYKTALLPPDRAVFEATLSKAELGDTAEFANNIELNCPQATA